MKALDIIRNTIAGHIQIDYRIACAMYNFNHKHICPDGKHAQRIAKLIYNRAQKIQTNKLAIILSKQLDTTQFPKFNLSDINDFIKLKRKVMKNKIFLGSFQLKQCVSYIPDY